MVDWLPDWLIIWLIVYLWVTWVHVDGELVDRVAHGGALEVVEAGDLEADGVDGVDEVNLDGVVVVAADVSAGGLDEARIDGLCVVPFGLGDVVADELKLVLEGAVLRAVLGEFERLGGS